MQTSDRFGAARQVQPTIARFTGLGELTRVHIAPGRLIPGTRYKALRWLGEGGMGVVYEAEHVDIGRRVAVKLLRHHFCADENVLTQFRQEARASAQIGSDGIIDVYDFAQLPDGRLMIAMELLQGQDVLGLLGPEYEPIDPGRVIGILRQCCKALGAAHRVGIVHRDIKPENVFLVTVNGRPDKVKLLDFGIAVVLSGDKTRRDLVGTPQYIAPEAITQGEVGPRMDQYAIGCVAYEMLTGKVAFDAPSVAQIIDAHLQEMPEPPSRVRATVPPSLDAVVMRCLSKDPAQRYEDMADLEAALCEAQIAADLVTPWDDLPLPEVSPERRDWLLTHMREPEVGVVGPQRKTWLWVALAGAVMFGGVTTAGFYALGDDPARETRSEIDEHVEAARAAAAKAYFVYPPAEDPKAPTAYREVRWLESMDGALAAKAKEQASDLRDEFAQTLVRLGDQYWEHEGGKVFAQAYYEQALLFVPDIEPAQERAALQADELELLEDKAQLARFSDAELIAAEPLNILAEPDEELRAKRHEDYLQRREQRLATLDQSLQQIARLSARPKKADLDVLAKHGAPEKNEPTIVLDEAALEDPTEGEPEATGKSDRPRSRTIEPEKARELAQQGQQAMSAGRGKEAELLFERALGHNPREPLALAGLRDLHFDRGSYGRAATYGKRLVGVQGNRAEHRLRLGDAYFKIARYAEAETQYAKALDLGDDRAKWRLEKTRERLGK